VTDHWEEC